MKFSFVVFFPFNYQIASPVLTPTDATSFLRQPLAYKEAHRKLEIIGLI
jgi:hypothetical protein